MTSTASVPLLWADPGMLVLSTTVTRRLESTLHPSKPLVIWWSPEVERSHYLLDFTAKMSPLQDVSRFQEKCMGHFDTNPATLRKSILHKNQ
mmetsp:Transcript_28497/g.52623  ORF Transcript_28497/g.52623 Transcript_28497/m.52623 type:complete len:92 (+) Transcript_28497:558-833(+)